MIDDEKKEFNSINVELSCLELFGITTSIHLTLDLTNRQKEKFKS